MILGFLFVVAILVVLYLVIKHPADVTSFEAEAKTVETDAKADAVKVETDVKKVL